MHVVLIDGAVAPALSHMPYQVRIVNVECLKEVPRKEKRGTLEDKVQTQRVTKVRGATMSIFEQLTVTVAVFD